jgi:flagellar biosynthetic protein FlhB
MSASDEDSGDKPHDPTQKRLDDLRAKGDLPRSADLATAAAYGGFLLAVTTSGAMVVQGLGTLGAILLGQADSFAPLLTQGAGGPLGGLLLAAILPVGAVLVLPGALALLCWIAQRAIVIAPENLMPQLQRISPLAAARHKFGIDGLFEFTKSTAKMGIVAATLGLFLAGRTDQILGAMQLSTGQAMAALADLLVAFLSIVLAISLVLGTVDLLWQRFRHGARNRMSREDLQDEMKDAEGDPYARQQRRQRGQQIALNQMLAEVPRADVVVVNPTHYAVALKWDRKTGRPPVCIAKGVDEVAARIREKAAEAGVPLHSDPPTARALYASLQIGDEVRPDQFRAVAAAIRFAEMMRRRAQGWHR